MLDAKVFAKYTGFTEEEVQALCRTYNSDFEKVKSAGMTDICWKSIRFIIQKQL